MSEQNVRRESVQDAPLAQYVRELESRVGELQVQVLQLEGVARLRAQQLSDTVHELRSPLVAVAGYARLLLKEHAGGINHTQRGYLGVILENAGRMSELLKQAGRSVGGLQLETFDLRELWRETADLIHSQDRGNLGRLEIRLPPVPCLVSADHDQLALAFHRLLSHVVRSSGPGAQVELEVSMRDQQITARIAGAGTDWPPEFVEGALGRESAPLEPSAEAYNIIRAHGGQVVVESAPRKGLCVSVTLPGLQPMAHREVEDANEQARRSGSR